MKRTWGTLMILKPRKSIDIPAAHPSGVPIRQAFSRRTIPKMISSIYRLRINFPLHLNYAYVWNVKRSFSLVYCYSSIIA